MVKAHTATGWDCRHTQLYNHTQQITSTVILFYFIVYQVRKDKTPEDILK